MSFVQTILLALAVGVVCEGAALNNCLAIENIFDTIDKCLYKNDNPAVALGASYNQNSPSLFAAVFDSGVLKDYSEELSKETDEILKQVCWLNYRENSANDLISESEKIRKCMDVSEKDIRKYFKKHDQEKFEADFNKDLMKCVSSTNRPEKLMDCYVNTSCKYLKKIKNDGENVSSKEKRCVRSEFESYINETNKLNDERIKCLKKVDDRKKK